MLTKAEKKWLYQRGYYAFKPTEMGAHASSWDEDAWIAFVDYSKSGKWLQNLLPKGGINEE